MKQNHSVFCGGKSGTPIVTRLDNLPCQCHDNLARDSHLQSGAAQNQKRKRDRDTSLYKQKGVSRGMEVKEERAE